MKKIGLALGGGGAKGFAHIPILEVFDELGVKPYCITGTSIGSIMGALYASGHSANDIAEMIRQLILPRGASLKDIIRGKEFFRVLDLIDPHFSLKPQGLLKGEKFLDFLYKQMKVTTFEELRIPFKAVATDFWRNEQVVFESGDILPAVRASMAIPYIFTPVNMDGRVLVDGGLVNNVPHDLLDDQCDIRIAVDIMGEQSTPKTKIPTPMDAVFHSYEVMQGSIANAKLEAHPVDIYMCPPLMNIDVLDFHKADDIYEQGLKIKDDFKRKLEHLLEGKKPFLDWLRRS
ncbi:MAG: patatin-like phospholipase family protein [Pontiella sp.]